MSAGNSGPATRWFASADRCPTKRWRGFGARPRPRQPSSTRSTIRSHRAKARLTMRRPCFRSYPPRCFLGYGSCWTRKDEEARKNRCVVARFRGYRAALASNRVGRRRVARVSEVMRERFARSARVIEKSRTAGLPGRVEMAVGGVIAALSSSPEPPLLPFVDLLTESIDLLDPEQLLHLASFMTMVRPRPGDWSSDPRISPGSGGPECAERGRPPDL